MFSPAAMTSAAGSDSDADDCYPTMCGSGYGLYESDSSTSDDSSSDSDNDSDSDDDSDDGDSAIDTILAEAVQRLRS